MAELIAYCGLDCGECPAYLATREDDDEKRVEVARIWSEQYDADISPEYINCEGCSTGSDVIIDFARDECDIRGCASEREVETCAHCDDYEGCGIIAKWAEMVPDAKTKLDELRESL